MVSILLVHARVTSHQEPPQLDVQTHTHITMPTPDFTDPVAFPSYANLPGMSNPPGATTPHYLLAQIGENMTITRPTLVLTDRAGDSFAMMFDGPIDLASRGLRKGSTAVVPWATRMGPKKEGGNGFVTVEPEMFDTVKALPAGLERVFAVGRRMRQGEGTEGMCSACGKVEGGEMELRRCTRCGGVRYCGKVSCGVSRW